MLHQKVSQLLEKIKKEDKKINSFLYISPNALKEAKALDSKKKKGKLYGKVLAIKSNINVKGLPTTCGSKTLENYIAPFDATVIEKIKAEDGLITGMLNMDEFAAGVSGETSAFGPTDNPKAPGKIPGGSSSGTAAALAANFCDITLGSDTGGSLRSPASHCGVIGVKPSYGLVSRYGLIDLSMSLDQIGPCTTSVEDAFLILNIIKGQDDKDTMTFESKPLKKQKISNPTFGVLSIPGTDPKIQELIDKKIELIEKLGFKQKKIKIKHLDLAVQTYYPLVYSEFFSATRRFDGRKYGFKIEDVANDEVLRRISGGSEITRAEFEGAYYQKAKQVKEFIKEEFEKAFKSVNCIISPTMPVLPWAIGKGKEMSLEEIYAADALTCPVNLTESCAISMPAGTLKNIPVGLQIICAKGQDNKLLNLASEIEKTEQISL